ncbi:MAG TPA: phosphoribosylanthranilate isomerase [Caulobacteraceae bacterium]
MRLAKICGLATREAVEASLEGGAAFLGFVFFPNSPRHIGVEAAAGLAERARGRARLVALLVDPSPDLVDDVVRGLAPDMLQLHGRETPERVVALRHTHGLPVIKALGVRQGTDLDAAPAYDAVADHLMLDAKPPEGSDRPGGHGGAFDWSILRGRTPARPWFLAGGLNPANVAGAIRETGAPMVDVSSGVESAPGVKDAALITAFLDAVRRA